VSAISHQYSSFTCYEEVKVDIQFNDSIIVMKTVIIEASGCEQLVQSCYAATPQLGIEPVTN